MIGAVPLRREKPAVKHDGVMEYRFRSAVTRLTRRRDGQSVNGRDVT